MSDIPVVEITPHATASPESVEKASSLPENAPVSSEEKPSGRWVRTRFCCCPLTAETDCRYHSPSEPGWETCPWEKRSGRGPGRWLWAPTKPAPLSDAELSVGADLKDLTKAQQQAGDRYLH